MLGMRKFISSFKRVSVSGIRGSISVPMAADLALAQLQSLGKDALIQLLVQQQQHSGGGTSES